MSSVLNNLSIINRDKLPDASEMRIGIVVSEWNHSITDALYEGAFKTLRSCKAKQENIITIKVPGSFELPLSAQTLFLQHKLDAVICLGCVIQGETKHFQFICEAVAKGLMELSIKHNVPFIFGVLTTENIEQAKERAGGKHGNKGVEAATTALKMIEMQRKVRDKDAE